MTREFSFTPWSTKFFVDPEQLTVAKRVLGQGAVIAYIHFRRTSGIPTMARFDDHGVAEDFAVWMAVQRLTGDAHG